MLLYSMIHVIWFKNKLAYIAVWAVPVLLIEVYYLKSLVATTLHGSQSEF